MNSSYRSMRVGKAAAACALSFLLAFPTPAVAFAATSTELQQQVSTAQETWGNLRAEAEQCQYELMNVRAQLQETENHINELNAQIPETEASLALAREELSEVVNEIYKGGNPSLLDVLMNATSFEDLVSRITYANKIAEHQDAVVRNAKALNDSLIQQKASLEAEKNNLLALEDEQENRLLAVEKASGEAESYYNALSDELKATIAAEEAEAQRAAYEASRAAALEAQRVAEEEAARNQQLADQQAAQQAAQEQQQQQQTEQPQAQPQAEQPQAQPQAEQPQEQVPAATVTEQAPVQQTVVAEPEAVEETPQVTVEQDYSADESAEEDTGSDYADESSNETESAYVGSAAAMVARAYSIIGAGYSYSGYNWTGSVSTSTFTCSGVVDYAMGLPSWSSSPESLYASVSNLVTSTSELSYGDLVFYSYGGRYPGHVGIYVGGGSIIDSIPNGGVGIRDVNYMDFIGGGSIY